MLFNGVHPDFETRLFGNDNEYNKVCSKACGEGRGERRVSSCVCVEGKFAFMDDLSHMYMWIVEVGVRVQMGG